MLKKYCDTHGYNMSSFTEKIIEEKTKPPTPITNKFTGEGKPVKGNTVFGFYDNESTFTQDCYSSMLWAANRMGYPVIEIELLDIQFYASYEEAAYEYVARKISSFKYGEVKPSGKTWIKKYFLALCKETLGMIRKKYQTIPIPGGQMKLDGDELVVEARVEKERLLLELCQL
jgi:hypothetical protein